MRLILYYSSTKNLLDDPANEGFDLDGVLHLLDELGEREESVTWEAVDTADLAEQELTDAYHEAIIPAIIKGRTGYNVKRVFGSRRLSGVHFGKGVPALLVYEGESKHPTDVYPHQLGQTPITIKEYLETLP